MVKKSYTINCGNKCSEILEKISEEIPGIYSATMDGGVIKIVFDDNYMGAREAIELIKDIVRSTRLSSAGSKGLTARLSVRHLQKVIGGPVHIEPLLDLLRLRGYRASSTSGYIETDAGLEEVVDMAMAISRCANETPKELLTPRARRIIIALCADSDASAEHVIGFLESRGVFTKSPDGRLDISRSIDEIRNTL
ncbi:MAG TPA: DUF2067 family protein [Sulfolobales archaeon]|nr:DUF2067 family protein [Sulfolobales archaeon]